MIKKEKIFTMSGDRRARAGDKAEKQMAFYLNRSFGEDPDVHVFNDLRIERNGEAAQMDHLLLHRHGLIIIESKSITGAVHINDRGEFTREHGNGRTGMPSPIQQATQQGELLRKLLIDNKVDLRSRKVFGLTQGGFKYCPVDVLVAISDDARIHRATQQSEAHDYVLKADQVAERVRRLIDEHRYRARLFTKDVEGKGQYSLTQQEMKDIVRFLLDRHTPIARDHSDNNVKGTHAKSESSPVSHTIKDNSPKSKAHVVYVCTHCHGTRLEIRFARSYYFKCLDCDGNTPIRNTCQFCNAPTKTSKRGNEYRSICASCGDSRVFFENLST